MESWAQGSFSLSGGGEEGGRRAGPVGVGQLFRRGGGRERRRDGERGRRVEKLTGPQPLAQCLENRLGGKGREGKKREGKGSVGGRERGRKGILISYGVPEAQPG